MLSKNGTQKELTETQEQRFTSANSLHDLASKTALMHYFCLLVIHARDYYKELGYNSFEDYCKNIWGYARSTAFRKIRTAQKIQDTLNYDLNSNQSRIAGLLDVGTQNGQLEQPQNNYLNEFLSLPSEKQSILSQMNQKDFDSLIKTGKARSKTFQEIKGLNRDALRFWAVNKKAASIKKEVQRNAKKEFEKEFSILGKKLKSFLIIVFESKTILEPDQKEMQDKINYCIEILNRYIELYEKD